MCFLSLRVASILTLFICLKAIGDVSCSPQTGDDFRVFFVSGRRLYKLVWNVFMHKRCNVLGSVFYPRSWYPLARCKSRLLFPAPSVHRPCRFRVSRGGDLLCGAHVLDSECPAASGKPAAWADTLPEKLDKHLSILPLWNLQLKKKIRCLLLLRDKGCFLLYKAASSVFWYPHCLNFRLRLADAQIALIWDVQDVCERAFWKTLLP